MGVPRYRAFFAAAALLFGSVAAFGSYGCGKKTDGNAPTAVEAPAPATTANGLRVTAGDHGFTPTSLVVPKGEAGATAPVTFVRTTDETCAREVVFPELGIKKDLPLKTPVTVEVPADSARTLTFQCGMAMYKGALVVK
jgi:plastocyanin domain-containing protein